MLPSTAEEAVGIVTVTRLLYGSDLDINVSSWHQQTQEHNNKSFPSHGKVTFQRPQHDFKKLQALTFCCFVKAESAC